MFQRFTFSSFRLLALSLCLSCVFSVLNAQSAVSLSSASTSAWKDQNTMDQIVQQELTETNASLALPNLTDWSLASLEAYRSMLTRVQSEMHVKGDMDAVLAGAYNWIKTEQVQNPPARQMVLDDMNAKVTELKQKLTFN